MYEVIAWQGQYAVGRDGAGNRFFYESLHPTEAEAEQQAAKLNAENYAADNLLPVVSTRGVMVRMWRYSGTANWAVERRTRAGEWKHVRYCDNRNDAEQCIAALTTPRKVKGKGAATPAAKRSVKRVPSEPARAKVVPAMPVPAGYVPIMQFAANDNSNTVAA